MNMPPCIPIYINTSMLQDLSTLLLDGYYNNKVCRTSYDNYILGRLQDLCRRQNTDDIKTSPVPLNNLSRPPSINSPYSPRGPQIDQTIAKDLRNLNLSLTFDEAFLNYDEFLKLFDTRSATFSEVTTTKNNTLSQLNTAIIECLKSQDNLKYINQCNESFTNVEVGDFIEFQGSLDINAIANYINNLISILNNYDTNFLDKTFDNKSIGPLTYTIIVNLLTTMENKLTNGNTSDILAFINNKMISLTLVKSYYNNIGYIFDSNNCNCKIIGKVTKTCFKNDDTINLFDKTGLPEYYSNLLISFLPYLNVLNNNGYLVPLNFIYKLPPPSLQIIPLSILI
ncbi:MAG: hypothetical protein E6929_09010 [Clostridium sp.]|nr:hypothetical protein [Clostridium sp.]